jgi:hypothetical protein
VRISPFRSVNELRSTLRLVILVLAKTKILGLAWTSPTSPRSFPKKTKVKVETTIATLVRYGWKCFIPKRLPSSARLCNAKNFFSSPSFSYFSYSVNYFQISFLRFCMFIREVPRFSPRSNGTPRFLPCLLLQDLRVSRLWLPI